MDQAKPLSLLYILFITAFCSCKKVIHVDLNSSSPRYVVEGNVTNQAGPYLVSITQSVNFDQLNVAPAVSGAIVLVTDNNTGQVDSLAETTPGNYYTHSITGTPGHTYKLYISVANNVFTASSTMPQPVLLDSLYPLQSSFGNNYSIVPVYTNNSNNGSYYHFSESRNDTQTSAIFIRKGSTEVSGVISQSLNGGGGGGGSSNSSLTDGDVVTIDMQCIDSAVYQYYSTLQQTNNQNSATPANPISNISGGALGYFSAHTSSERTAVVP
jgi:hypothetical protein